MVNVIVWLIAGAVIGGVAAMLMRHEEDAGVFANVVLGVGGALVAGWFAAPAIGLRLANPSVFHLGALGVALFGAVAVLAISGLVRRRR